MTRKRAGTYATFERRYKPIALADGTVLREKQAMPEGVDWQRVWTVVDCDNGKQYLCPGLHLVNRVGYVLCGVSFPMEECTSPGYVY
jgi:hypothetical protein